MGKRNSTVCTEVSQDFQRCVYSSLEEGLRAFPWRETSDPYHILVSEIMLQQTQTSRVLPKYLDFLREFPSVVALSEANFSKVLSLWKGLGYNRRAQALHNCARQVVEKYQSRIPSDKQELKSLPGIGDYTSAAVRVFAFGLEDVMVETNIKTVYIHHFFSDLDLVPDKLIAEKVAATMDRKDLKRWYYALMDYGVILKSRGVQVHRKSSSYRKQSKFNGSLRQVRGAVIRELLSGPKTLDHLTELCSNGSSSRCQEALSGLLSDRMVVQEVSGKYNVYEKD